MLTLRQELFPLRGMLQIKDVPVTGGRLQALPEIITKLSRSFFGFDVDMCVSGNNGVGG